MESQDASPDGVRVLGLGKVRTEESVNCEGIASCRARSKSPMDENDDGARFFSLSFAVAFRDYCRSVCSARLSVVILRMTILTDIHSSVR